MSNPVEPLVTWLQALQQIDSETEAEVRLCLLDTLACVAAGKQAPVYAKVKASIAARSATVELGDRALLLGSAAHALDFDDSEILGSTHPSAVLFACLLPLGQARNATPAELCVAYVAGFESIAWFGRVLGYRHYDAGWHATATIGVLGATAACAKLLNLNATHTDAALRIACSFAAGLKKQFGSDTKAIHAGMVAKHAIEVVMLAQAGCTGGAEVWQGATGYFALHAAANPDASDAHRALGEISAFSSVGVVRKAYPCCHYTHRLIDAAKEVARDMNAGDIEAIELEMPAPYYAVVANAAPSTPDQARFSASYCTASALIDGDITLASFSEAALARPAITELLPRVTALPYTCDGLPDLSPDAPDTLHVKRRGGERISIEVVDVRGTRGLPLGETALRTKTAQCCRPAHSGAQVEALVEFCLDDSSRARDRSVQTAPLPFLHV